MQRYESYKPSGIQWVETIPSHWGAERAKWLFNRMERPVRPEDDVVTAFRDGQVTLRTNRRTEGFTNAIQEHGYQGIRKGDLVIHAMDAFAGAIGVSDSDGKSTPVYAACVPRGEYPVNSYYYAYLLRYMAHSGYIESLSKGIRERSTDFRFAEFRELPLPIPEKDEQDRIVAFLDQKTAEIDAAIAKKELLIELLNEQKSIVTNHAVTRGLNPGAPVKDSGVGWLGEIPSHWMVKRVKHLARKIVDGAHHTPTYVDSGVPFLRVTDISGGKKAIDLDNVKRIPVREHKALCQRAFPQKGDVLLSKNGTIGETIVVDWDYEFSIFVSLCLIKLRGEIDPHFFCLYFSSPVVDLQLAEGGKRTSVTNLHLEKIKELVLALPPIEEQREIVRMIRNQLSPYDDLIEKTHCELIALNDFRKSLTTSVVVGVVKV